MVQAENSETDFIHSLYLPRRKAVAVARLQQVSCNKGRCSEGMKDVNVFSAWPTKSLTQNKEGMKILIAYFRVFRG